MLKENRLLPIKGAYNVRDLGGYKGYNNRKVKWGKVFRSGDLSNLMPEDQVYLCSIPLVSCIDFRNENERTKSPTIYIESVQNTYLLPIGAANISLKVLDEEKAKCFLFDSNRNFVEHCQEQYSRFFEILSENRGPLLFHCSAGKDRTGFAAALFLSALGVDKKHIIEDYMLSNKYLKDKYLSLENRFPYLKPVLTARPEYLETAFNTIEDKYKNTEYYLKNILKADLNLIRELYLE